MNVSIRPLQRPLVKRLRLSCFDQRRSITIDQLDADKKGRDRVVVLGSGWAGYNLARRLDSKLYQTVVVSPRSYFVFTPLLASTSVGTLEFRTAIEPLRTRSCTFDYLQGRCDGVDFGKREVLIRETVRDPNRGLLSNLTDDHEDDHRSLEMKIREGRGSLFALTYDKLAITVGSYSQTFGIPGVTDNAYFLKDVSDARKIRGKLISCFETAALPTTPVSLQKQLLNFAIVGGGPTGIEFSGELRDIIRQDMARLYPALMEHVQITVYDVADKILPMFENKLAHYAMDHLDKSGINIKTGHRIQELRRGLPQTGTAGDVNDDVKASGFTLSLENGSAHEVGCGLVVWSTGLMSNPFVGKMLGKPFAAENLNMRSLQGTHVSPPIETQWRVEKHSRTGSVITDDHLRLRLQSGESTGILDDVYALGDCAVISGTQDPATAQVASQKAYWLADHLNKQRPQGLKGFFFQSAGIMAYLGRGNAIAQLKQGSISGRTAWLIWRSAYLVRSVSWRNKILIPMFWLMNWAFGRDVGRF